MNKVFKLVLRLTLVLGCLPGATACSSIVNGKLDELDVDCTGSTDGTACGEGQICLGEVCLNTRCGDGYVNAEAGEDCEDANDVSGDGCEPSSCVFSCASGDECADEDPCNGTEICSETSRRCEAGTPPTEETMCDLGGAEPGVCSGGLCAPPGCGDGFEDEGEECDDGNTVTRDGCEPNCTFSCVEDLDCSDGDACNGEETCIVATHICADAIDLSCDDADTCTADSCDPVMGCTFALIDGDGDGYASPDTCTTPDLKGGDCNDSNDAIYPNAPELCDSMNNDCDDTIDEDIVEVECRMDMDNDGYGDDRAAISACVCPAGIPPRPDGRLDCYDGDSNVHEGQTSYFTTRYCVASRTCGSNLPFDYDCDGVETRQNTDVAFTCRRESSSTFGRCIGSGWTNGVPGCGASGLFQTCSVGGALGCTSLRPSSRTQACR